MRHLAPELVGEPPAPVEYRPRRGYDVLPTPPDAVPATGVVLDARMVDARSESGASRRWSRGSSTRSRASYESPAGVSTSAPSATVAGPSISSGSSYQRTRSPTRLRARQRNDLGAASIARPSASSRAPDARLVGSRQRDLRQSACTDVEVGGERPPPAPVAGAERGDVAGVDGLRGHLRRAADGTVLDLVVPQQAIDVEAVLGGELDDLALAEQQVGRRERQRVALQAPTQRHRVTHLEVADEHVHLGAAVRRRSRTPTADGRAAC